MSAARAVSRAYLAGGPPSRGRSWGWARGSALAAAIPAPRGRAAGGAPPPTWAGKKAEASVGTFPRCCVRALEGCLVSHWGERTVAGPREPRAEDLSSGSQPEVPQHSGVDPQIAAPPPQPGRRSDSWYLLV